MPGKGEGGGSVRLLVTILALAQFGCSTFILREDDDVRARSPMPKTPCRTASPRSFEPSQMLNRPGFAGGEGVGVGNLVGVSRAGSKSAASAAAGIPPPSRVWRGATRQRPLA